MATLESGFNPIYSENAAVLTGNPNRVTVEVEDTIDKDFWSDLLGGLCPEKEFHFDPYHTILQGDGKSERTGKGKAQIIKASADFNAWHIGCVDSDYDWILSDYSHEGKIIVSNKYLLQTYAYSIENLMCLPSTLEGCCYAATEESSGFDFVDYLCRLSKAVFPLLVWSAYLYSKGDHAFTPAAWRNVLVNTEKDSEASLARIEAKAKAKIEELNNAFAVEITAKDKMGQSLFEEKNVTEESAYLYVRGHELFDHLLHTVLTPIIKSLRHQHYNALKASGMDDCSLKMVLQKYDTNAIPIWKILSKNYQYKNLTPLYDKIKADVSQIWD